MIDPLDHQGLVYSIAFRFRGRGVDLDDLVQEGQFGLLRAAEKFRPELGFQFSTYAKRWVEQFMQRAIENQGSFIRLPSHIRQKVYQGVKPDAPGLKANERELLALAITASSAKVSRGCDLAANEMSLAEVAEARTSELPSDEDVHELVRAILSLDSRNRRVLRLLYGLGGHPPLLPREVAAKLGITRERVRQLRNEALRELRKRLNPPSQTRRAG